MGWKSSEKDKDYIDQFDRMKVIEAEKSDQKNIFYTSPLDPRRQMETPRSDGKNIVYTSPTDPSRGGEAPKYEEKNIVYTSPSDPRRPVKTPKSNGQNIFYTTSNSNSTEPSGSSSTGPPPAYTPSAPIKTYTITNTATMNPTRRQSIALDGKPILLVNRESPFLGRPTIHIQHASDNFALAACRLRHMSSDLRILRGDPCNSAEEAWGDVICQTFRQSKYSFSAHDGAGGVRNLTWTRTHDKSLGARRFGEEDFKLVDASGGRVLAVFIKGSAWSRSDFGKVEWFEDIGKEVELFCLATILGIEEQIRRRNQSAAAGAVAGGGGGGGA